VTPTAEQQAIVEAYGASKNLVIEAGAGTGKTSTLRMTAAARPKRRATYIAYNRAIADDARRSFPPNVQCATAHSLAFRAVGRQFRHRLNGPRMPARMTAKLLRVDPLRVSEDVVLTAQQVARLVTDTVARFCYSADPDPHGGHVPALPGANSPAARAVLRQALVPLARKAWADLSHPNGELKFTHDCYLKLWQLSGPVLDADTVFLDEAQDANPLIADIVERQTHAQRVLVGDRCQAIYGWRGAIDAMRDFHADARLALSQSFRFGEPIATEANKWLQILQAPLRLGGADHVHSAVGPLGAVDAVLCRTNAEAVSQLMSAAGNGRRVALVGGGADIRRLAEAAIDLQAGRPTSHPELMAFTSWGMVQEYVDQEETGSDLKVFVQLIDRHGPEVIIDTTDRLVDERYASLVVSTAHKAKGREWPRVRIAQDFREPKGENANIAPADAMLAYVAVTRARHGLDRDGLAWVDGWLDGRPPARQQGSSW